jgi:hypothetical protein
MSLASASRRAGFEPILPRSHGRIYAADGIVATPVAAGRAVLTEFRADIGLTKKFVGPATRVEPVTVNGRDGLWLEGAPHVVMSFDSKGLGRERVVRLAGNVLVWPRGSLTLRLEGPLTRDQALRLAKTVG